MGEYEDTLKDIKETLGIIPGFMKALSGDVLVKDWGLWKKYSFTETEIPCKYREMIGLSAAANIKCPYYQAMHTAMAKFHGATDRELSEVYYLASLTARWSAMTHAQNYPYEKFKQELRQIGQYLVRQQCKEIRHVKNSKLS